MRSLWAVSICLACALVVGCSEEQAGEQTRKNLDVELVNTLNNVGVENAIITQHTLYPYHFGVDAGELNELGQRDLMVLARHFKDHPGILNIRRGEAMDVLYEARVAHVLTRLKDAGVETARMSVSDGMPGGPGMPSERVVTIVQAQGEPPAGMRTGTGSSGMITR